MADLRGKFGMGRRLRASREFAKYARALAMREWRAFGVAVEAGVASERATSCLQSRREVSKFEEFPLEMY